MASIQKRKQSANGRVSYRVLYRNPEGKLRSESKSTLAEARARAAEVEHGKNIGAYVDRAKGRVTVGEFAPGVMELHGIDHRESTRVQQETMLRRHVLPHFAKRPLAAVTRTEVQKWVKELSKTKSPATVRQAKLVLGVIFTEAVEANHIVESPVRKIKMPKIEKAPMRILTEKEIFKLADAIDPRYRTLILTAAFTGCRFGELAALRVGHDGLDLKNKRLTVSASLSEVKGRVVTNPPKNGLDRPIRLPRFLVTELAAYLLEHPPAEYVFTAPQGGPLRRSSWRTRYWLPAVAAAGFDGLTFHSLRHSHASMLINAGQNIKVVQERLGHQSAEITLDVYSHLFPGADEAAADQLDELIAAAAE